MTPDPPSLAFLANGGDMARQIRSFDWTCTPLGAPQDWPVSLRVALSICLQSDFPTAIYWGDDLRVVYNDAWAPVLAERHPWALGRPAQEVWPDIWAIIEPQMRRVRKDRRAFSTYDAMLPMVRAGRTRETYWTYSLTPITDECGTVVGIFNQGHETTAAVLSAQRSQTEIERFRELFARAPGAVAVLRGPQHVFEMANRAYIELVGGRDVLGKPVAEALPEVVPQGYITLLDRVLKDGIAHGDQGVPVQLRRDGILQERIVDFVFQPMRDEAGQPTGVLVQALDTTDRHHALVELREADRRKDLFLATLAHELRNPLAPLSNGLALLERGLPADSPLLPTRSMMQRQLLHLVHLIDDLMEVSRITSGKITLRNRRTSLQAVVARAVEACSAAIERRRQSIVVTDAAVAFPLDGDIERLTQAFVNLLNNASKFTPAGGHIELHMTAEGAEAVVRVVDDGIGLLPSDIARVFGMFVQVRGSDAGDGLGLGLALAAELVSLHGGSIRAASPGLGQGTTFTVRLPLARQDLAVA